MKLLGVDTGGTFTDFVLYESGKLSVHKVLSTPQSPELAILQGIRELGISMHGLKLIHGSTVATNAVLEGKGVKTVYVSNYGLKDVLHIGRQARRELYNLQPKSISHPLSRSLCLETGGRLSAKGEIVDDLTSQEVEKLKTQIEQIKPTAIAINLMFSFLNPEFEQRLKAALPKNIFISCSSDILPEYKEYERGMTTWLNAYVGPLVEMYLKKLSEKIKPAKLSVMLSAGGTASAEVAGRKAVHMLLSGPAGGLQAAKYVGQQMGCNQLLTLDMGGTSTDVALIDGDFKLSSESTIAGLPVAVPMVDMHTIGAGGGSIAQVDEGGLLQVGPESAGALPGPACYKNGGELATVTDANVVLGRLPTQVSLGGSLQLDVDLAKRAVQKIADQLECSLEHAALGIIKITNEHMAQALRVISVQKGVDPRQYTLMSFGGAGGLHVCDLAESMDMRNAIVPIQGGVFSAFGMLIAPVGRELSKTFMGLLIEVSEVDIKNVMATLAQQGMDEMISEGILGSDILHNESVDLRYRGQSYTLNVPWENIQQSIMDFHATHEQRYGHKLEETVEIVNIRLSLKAPTEPLKWQKNLEKTDTKPISYVSLPALAGDFDERVPIWLREDVIAGLKIRGPALIIESVATILIKLGWIAEADLQGHLKLSQCEKCK